MSQDRALKFLICCAIGAGIGTFLTLQLTPAFWWIGCIVGGSISGLTFEARAIVQAFQRGWPEFKHNLKNNRDDQKVQWEQWKSIIKLNELTSAVFVLFVLGKFMEVQNYDVALSFIVILVPWSVILITMMFKTEFWIKEMKEPTEMKKLLWYVNPIAFLVYWPFVFLFSFIPKMVKLLFRFLGACARFIIRVFVLVYSEAMLLCMLWGALGTGIGYFAGSVLIGAAAGGLFGFANYKLISPLVKSESES